MEKLSKPQQLLYNLLKDGNRLNDSNYFYGFHMPLQNGENKYFRRDTVESMVRKGFIIKWGSAYFIRK